MKTQHLILAPLLVMVLLTFLVGGTAYQQTVAWEAEVSKVVSNVSRIVILGNIRWGIRKIEREQLEHPEQAQSDWSEIYREALLLSEIERKLETPERSALSPTLQSILNNPNPTPKVISGLAQSDFFAFGLEQLGDLQSLQAEAKRVTQWVTISMIVLGLVLTGITAYDLDRLIQQLAHSRDLNIRLQEEERRRIAQDLHDGVVQELIDLKRNYTPDKVDAVVNNLRRVCHNLKPQVLEDLGLASALEFLADDLRQYGIAHVHINLDEAGLAQLPKHYELPLFRVIQELCSNIKHHAQASQVKITVAYNPLESRSLSASIQDNGTGFELKKVRGKGMGLTGVQERVQQMHGTLSIQSQPGQGSRFQLIIPVKANVQTTTTV